MATQPAFVADPAAPLRGKKYFSLTQANRALVYVTRVVRDMDQTYKDAMAIRRRAERARPQDDQEALREHYEICMDRLNELIDELHLVGVEFKDFEMGLVEFPALHQGRQVYLSWRRGEENITCWHEVDCGYAQRQDVGLLAA